MRSSGTPPIRVALLTAVLSARAWAGDSAALRAADAGLSPEFCPTLRALVDAAAGGFTSLRGSARAGGENVWDGTRRLPGSDCAAFGGTPPAYVCTLYAGDVEDNADGAYDRAVSGLKDCLTGNWKTTEKVDGTHARTTSASRSGGPSVRVVEHDVSADAYLVEVWVDAAKR